LPPGDRTQFETVGGKLHKCAYKGRLIDLASIRQAHVIVRQSEMIAG
jgi:hypothetical protein